MTILTRLQSMRALIGEAKKELIIDLNLKITEATLDLSKQNLSLEDIENLAQTLIQNDKVVCLQLRENAINDEGVMVLLNLLQENTTIQSLDLQGNHITQVGACALARLLMNSACAVTELDLRYNRIGLTGCQIIAHACAMSHRKKEGKAWILEGEHPPEICTLFDYARHQATPLKRINGVIMHLQDSPTLPDLTDSAAQPLDGTISQVIGHTIQEIGSAFKSVFKIS